MAKLKMPKSKWHTSKSGRKNTVTDRARVIIGARIPDDPEYVACFIRTSPTIQRILADDGFEVEEDDIVEEALALHLALGDSTEALHPHHDHEGKYRELFTFAHAVHPTDHRPVVEDRFTNHTPFVSDEGPVPTFYQYQRQDLETILEHYASHRSMIHGPDHICRSLILAMAMAKFYLKHGQTQYLPGGDVAPTDLPAPTPSEVDISTISYAVGFHDSGRDAEGRDVWEHESGRNAYYYLRELGFGIEYSANVARIIVKNDETNSGRPTEATVSRTTPDVAEGTSHRNALREDPPPAPDNRPRCINEMITHDADTLEIMRLLLTRPRTPFIPDRLLFLQHADFDESLDDSGFDRDAMRGAIIADARDFAQLTLIYPGGTPRDEEREGVWQRFQEYVTSTTGHRYGGFDPMLKEYERYLIDAIFADPTAFPFLYQYYFEACFDPNCHELLRLTSEQRLAVIRTRLHGLERERRDRQWADRAMTQFDAEYDLETVMQTIVDARVTMNFTYETLTTIVDSFADAGPARSRRSSSVSSSASAGSVGSVGSTGSTSSAASTGSAGSTGTVGSAGSVGSAVSVLSAGSRQSVGSASSDEDEGPAHPDALYKQFWEIFWYLGIPRTGGAANDPKARDDAERRKLNYLVWHTNPDFRRHDTPGRPRCFDRPNYAGVNAAQIAAGAVTKYGKCAAYINRHVLPRVTYTFRDTFPPDVRPDHAAAPMCPLAIMRQIMDVAGMDVRLLRTYGARHGWDDSEDSILELGKSKRLAPVMYIEAQVHGPVSWRDDIEAIVIEVTTNPFDATNEPRIIAFCAKYGIRLGFAVSGHDEIYTSRADASAVAMGGDGSGFATIDLFTPPRAGRDAAAAPLPVVRTRSDSAASDASGGSAAAPAEEEVEVKPTCESFQPNRWDPHRCTNCQSTPNSAECIRWGKSCPK